MREFMHSSNTAAPGASSPYAPAAAGHVLAAFPCLRREFWKGQEIPTAYDSIAATIDTHPLVLIPPK